MPLPTAEEQREFAEKWAGKLVEWVGDSLEDHPKQDVVVVGYPTPSPDFVTVCLTHGEGWRRSDASVASHVTWLRPTDPSDPKVYWHVMIRHLTPRPDAPAAPPSYAAYPKKCPVCGEPAYIGAFEVDCISPSCIHHKGTRP